MDGLITLPFSLAIEVVAYLVFGGMAIGVTAGAVLLLSAPVAIWRGGRWYATWLAKVCLLFGCLWIWGLPGHLLFAGFAWGAGAFLAMTPHMPTGAMALFVAAGGVSVGVLLREQEMLFRFLAPAAVLTSLACVLRPSAGGVPDLALVLIVSAAIGGVSVLAERLRNRASEMPELAGFPTA